MKKTMTRNGLLLSIFSLAFLLGACGGAGNDVECGLGTKLDATTHSCVVDDTDGSGGFNGVVDSATLGDFTLTNLSFPDRLIPGVEMEHSVTISNKTTKSSDLTMIRVALVKGTESSVGDYLKNVAGVGTVCANANCTSSTVLPSCSLHLDANNNLLDDQGSCSSGYYCHPVSKLCFLKLNPVAAFSVESIPAGTSVTKTYKISLPADWKSDAGASSMRLVYLIGEESLIYNANGEVIENPDATSTLPTNQDSIVRAKGVLQAGPTNVIVPIDPDLAMVSARLDNTSFELDNSPDNSKPELVLHARIKAIGADLRAQTRVKITLLLPGMVQITCGSASGLENYNYTRERTIPLTVDDISSETRACGYGTCLVTTPLDPSCFKTKTCTSDTVVMKSGEEKDVTFRLHVSEASKKLLSDTLNHRDLHPDLNKFDELPGKLQISIDYENKFGSPTSASLDVVFMPPEQTRSASASDGTEPTDTLSDENDLFASDYSDGLYPEKDNLTPTLYNSFGSDWAGASYQLKNISSKERLYQAVVKQAFVADNFFKLSLFQFDLYLLKASADIDFGTRRALSTNVATGEIMVPQLISNEDIANAIFSLNPGGLQLMNTLLAFDFDGTKCTDENDLEHCTIIGGNDSAVEWDTSIDMPSNNYSVDYQASESQAFCEGPLCFVASMEVTFTAGIEGTLGIFRDKTQAPEYVTGFEVTLGPYATADGSASGELSVILASIAIIGEVNFLDARFTPTVRFGVAQKLNATSNPPCWWTNNGRIEFSGPASLKTLSGDVRVEAYVGREIDLGFYTIDLKEKVFEFTLVSWDSVYSNDWMLWKEIKNFSGGPGLCTDAPNPDITWKTPIGCKSLTGADGYCPLAIPYAKNGSPVKASELPLNYHGGYAGRFYLGPSQCGTLIVSGNVERWNTGNCNPGDAFNLTFGPLGPSIAQQVVFEGTPAKSGIHPENINDCRWETSTDSGTTITGGTMFCGDGNMRRQMRNYIEGPYSGQFNETRFTYCPSDTSRERYRYIDMFLKTDASTSLTGLTVKMESQEGAESAVYSDERWWAVDLPNHDRFTTDDWKFKDGDPNRDFRRATSAGTLYSAPWYATASSPFDANDAHQAKWIWASNPSTAPYGWVSFRRPFLAAKSSYSVQLRCDNECKVYIDGKAVGGNKAWNVPSNFTVTTDINRMHMIAVEARNDDPNGGWAGMNFMMK